MTLANRYLIFIFITFSFAVMLVSYLITHSRVFMENPEILSFGLTFDITISIPIFYYFLARKRKLPKALLIPIFILTVIAASLIIPRDQHQFLDMVKYAFFPIETFIFSYLIFKITRIVKEYKRLKPRKHQAFSRILKESLIKIIGPGKISDILTTEISILYFGLFAWKNPKHPDENTFTLHKKSCYGSIIGALAFLTFSETAAFHIIFMQVNSIAAWIILVLNIYGIIFFFADLNATKREPIYIEDEKLYINAGIRWKTIIPLENIESLESPDISYWKDKLALKALPILVSPNLVIVLKKPQKADGPYGFRKNFDKVILNLDEPQRFKQFF